MACDTWVRANQSLTERKEEVKKVLTRVEAALQSRLVRVKVDRATGAVAFDGISDADRAGVTDACIYRRIMVSGSALARAQIARAEQLAGRQVDRKVLAGGLHSHDGGQTWGTHR